MTTKVPVVPFTRPIPNAMRKGKVPMSKAAVKATKTEAPKFTATNSEDITKKHPLLQRVWRVAEKFDPTGELWVNDHALCVLQGAGLPGRSAKDLGFSKEDIALLSRFGVYDNPNTPDSPVGANGVILTNYQVLEMAFEMGRMSGIAAVQADASDDDDVDEDIDDDDAQESLAEEDPVTNSEDL